MRERLSLLLHAGHALAALAKALLLGSVLASLGCSITLSDRTHEPPSPVDPAPAPAVVVPTDLPEDGSRPVVDPCESLRAELSAAQARVIELESRPVPVVPLTIETTEDDYWDSLAALVEQGRITDTDVVCKLVELLKADGLIRDDGRIAEWKVLGGRKQIDDANRMSIVLTLRGN